MAVTNADILGWLNANPDATPELINKTMVEAGVTPAQVSAAISGNTSAAQQYLTQQILGQGTTDKWTGEGFGSAKANAADMAKILSGIGITDINQFGQITKEVPAYSYDENGNEIQTGTQTVTTFGNKETGQEVPNTYSERQTGNAFGGTFAGKGNTGYRVDFAPNGTPVFYTTGASSSDASQWMPIVQLALAATGAGGLLGNALLGAGASEIASSALGNAILGGATTGIAGGDVLKGALLGGAGGALSGYLQGGPIDASNMTSAQFNDALENQLIKSMQGAGLTTQQISQWLENASAGDISSVVNALPVTGASDQLVIDAAKTPITANALTHILSQVPTITTTGAKTTEQVSPDTLNAVTSLLNSNLNTATPTVEVKATNPNKPEVPVVTPITSNLPVTTPPTVEVTAVNPNKPEIPVITPITTTVPTTTTTTPDKTKDTTLTTSDIIKLVSVVPALVAINKATTPSTPSTPTYPVVDVPAEWKSPVKTTVAPYTPLTPIDFGSRNLLKGTQWEKFLDPNYGKVPEPVQYSQPSNLSYNDLMGILGSKQGMPPASSLSINDIISGIQNQYGQAPRSTMG